MNRFRFDLAGPGDDAALRAFALRSDMPGAVRLAFGREPDYAGALRVEGQHTEVLVCREAETGRLVATGHRSVKTLYVNGHPAPVGYLSGLRLDPSCRRHGVLARGYAFLRGRHSDGRTRLYLTTIFEDNTEARRLLTSRRAGLPSYHDAGRFRCLAFSMGGGVGMQAPADLIVQPATAGLAERIVDFLRAEGPARQFFPRYSVSDFGQPGGLLRGLAWEEVFVARRGDTIVGTLAAWDQRPFRQCLVHGYGGWLRWVRRPLNALLTLSGRPPWPAPGSPLNLVVFALPCVRHQDRAVFGALVDAVLRSRGERFDFGVAGLHERDPLLPVLLRRPHVSLSSRLYIACWDDGEESFRSLNPDLVPYLETGAL